MSDIPTGVVTFLFTDIEGSTKLAQNFPETIQSALLKHHSILKSAFTSNNGFIFDIVGDSFFSAFKNPNDAINAAIEIQYKLSREKWDEAVMKVRIGIHNGDVEWNGQNYIGYITLAQTSRIMSSAYGEQILISENVYELVKDKLSLPKHLPDGKAGKFGDELIVTEISFRDLGERKLQDVIQPIRLYQILFKGLRENFPPLKTLDARPNNLPVQLTSFIGRESEMKLIADLLKKNRMITLTGTGGAGKTRLSLQIVANVIDDFTNGVWFVELASLTEPLSISKAILDVLNLKEQPGKSPEEIILQFLKDKQILIIFDNCEHLIKSCAELSEKLLRQSHGLKIIATSREALRCTGEIIHRVLSLDTPDSKIDMTLESLMQYESIRLFTERAIAINKNFKINDNNAKALTEICFHLDGIPLAIELAAARTNSLSIEKINQRLVDRFNLLKEGRRTSLPRQKTLRALIDWSHDLLSEEEKILWRKLSVFSGGWTLEAAEEICSNDKLKKVEIFELLNQLNEKSIIIYNSENERYRILESLKQYGEEKLKEAREVKNVLSRHLHYYMEFSETAEAKLSGSEVQNWLEKLESEHSNLQSAIEWSVRSESKESGARLAVALGSFWVKHGHYSTGIRLLNSILDNRQGVSNSVIGKALNWNGVFSRNLGKYEQAQKFFEESLALRRRIGDKRGIANSLNGLGAIGMLQGNYEQAGKFFEEGLALACEIGDKRVIANSLNNMGLLSHKLRHYEEAQKFFEQSLTLRRELNDRFDIAMSLNNIGNLADDQRNYEQARKFHQESLVLKRELRDKHGISYSLFNLGNVANDLCNYEEARKFYSEALALDREIGDKPGMADCLQSLGKIEIDAKNFEQAKKFYEESLTLRREIGDIGGIAESLIGFAAILKNGNQLSDAAKLLGTADAVLKSMGLVLHRIEQKHFEQISNQILKVLFEEEFSKYFEEGKKLTLEQAYSIINVQ